MLIRQITISLALAAICAVPQSSAQQQRAQQFPSRPMPPDIVAPPDTRPANAPKPERNRLPQSDQPANAASQPRPAANPPSTAPARAAAPHKMAPRKRGAKPSPVPQPEPAPQVATAPPPPPTPQQMPPSPPQVEYRDGLLTVSAKNSTLLDVLNAIRSRSGATMTLPPAGLSDRIFVEAGPAPARDVLSRLLSGTNFDYVLVGSPDNPGSLQQVIVTQRQPGGVPMTQGPSNPGGYPQQSRLPGMGAPSNEEEEEPAPRPQQPQYQPMPGFGGAAPGGPGPFQPNPMMAPPGVANPTPVQPTPGPTGLAPVQPPQQPPQMPPPGMQTGQPPQQQQPKTPEQLLQELKQMQQQQQQQQRPPQ